jgi:hypothetical protein
MHTLRCSCILAILGLGLISVPAFADVLLYDFSNGSQTGGNISALGGSIALGTLVVTDLSSFSPSESYYTTSESLTFDTAAGTLSIAGTVPGFYSGTLLSITGLTSSTTGCGSGDTSCDISFLSGTVSIPGGGTFGSGYSEASGTSNGGPWSAFSTDVQWEELQPVPEPGTISLFASGLVMAGGLLRRKLFQH